MGEVKTSNPFTADITGRLPFTNILVTKH